MAQETHEKTLLLLKPDAVRRGLVGECISRFEQRGFTLCAMKLIHVDEAMMREHYKENANNPEWLKRVGADTLEAFHSSGKDPQAQLGTTDVTAVGRMGIDWLVEFMTSGPIVALVISGQHAVEMARKIVGHTMPMKADIGSIRGDFSIDSPITAALEKRTVQNFIHASGTKEEAEQEIRHWFRDDELCS